MPASPVLIPNDLVSDVANHLAQSFPGLLPKGAFFDGLARDFMSVDRVAGQIQELFNHTGLQPQGQDILEVGSGFGLFVVAAHRLFGLKVIGLEPDDGYFKGTFAISMRLLAANGLKPNLIKAGVGEEMPFADQSFDLVYSTNVLEHVADPAQVLREAARVTRKGGIIHFIFPNYGSFWEGHYGIFWPPNLGKPLGRLYVRLLGRNPAMIDSLNMINYRQMTKFLADMHDQVEVLSTGSEHWVRRMRDAAVEPYALLPILKRWVDRLHQWGLVEWFIRLGLRFHWETPFVLTLRKL